MLAWLRSWVFPRSGDGRRPRAKCATTPSDVDVSMASTVPCNRTIDEPGAAPLRRGAPPTDESIARVPSADAERPSSAAREPAMPTHHAIPNALLGGASRSKRQSPASWSGTLPSPPTLSATVDGLAHGTRRSRDGSLVEVVTGLRARVAYLTSQLAIAQRQASAAAAPPACAVCAQRGATAPPPAGERGITADLESIVQAKGIASVDDLGLAASVPTTPRRGTRQRRARHELRTIVAKASEGAVSRTRQTSQLAAPPAHADRPLEPTRIETSRPVGAVDFADLELVRPLGSGAYGAVSLMRHAPTGVLYAVKAVSKAHITAGANAAKLVFRLRREREALYALRGHPCILKLHGTAADATHVYLVTELCAGGELFGLLAEGPLPEAHVRFYGASVVLALETAHRRGIVYRDLKPENVLLDSNGWVRLADFGAAAYIGAPTDDAPAGRALSRFGTFEYMSPEVARGDKAGHSLETDWWSLGAMLFELLVGRTPCVADNAGSDLAVIARVASGEVIWPRSFEPQLSPDARDLIAQLLTVDQERRLGSRARGGAAGVRAHRFFARADFAAIVNRCFSYPPPWIPNLAAADDTSFTPSHQDPGEYNSLRAAAQKLAYDGDTWERHFAEF